jgi:hypothetical protein
MTRTVAALLLFGISFGYVEAAVVVYLRGIYEPLRQRISPRPPNELFPLITTKQLQDSGPENTRRLITELGREAATILMLGAIALAVTSNPQQWFAAFLVAFGTWDIFFYVFLKLLIGWPASLLTWDLLFLIPLPWVGPVLAPVIVAASFIGCGLFVLYRPIQIGLPHWAAILTGGFIIFVSFLWDYENTTAGGMPNAFAWWVFATGELIALAGFIAAAAGRGSRVSQTQPGY